MAFIKLGQVDDIFSEESYNDFLKSESVVPNTRQRDNGVSFIDAMLSPEADFTKSENGENIVSSLKSLPW